MLFFPFGHEIDLLVWVLEKGVQELNVVHEIGFDVFKVLLILNVDLGILWFLIILHCVVYFHLIEVWLVALLQKAILKLINIADLYGSNLDLEIGRLRIAVLMKHSGLFACSSFLKDVVHQPHSSNVDYPSRTAPFVGVEHFELLRLCIFVLFLEFDSLAKAVDLGGVSLLHYNFDDEFPLEVVASENGYIVDLNLHSANSTSCLSLRSTLG